MKKIIMVIFSFLLTIFLGLNVVKADNILLEDVVNTLKTNNKSNSNITSTSNSIIIESIKDGVTYTTIFNYSNGIISFTHNNLNQTMNDYIKFTMDITWCDELIAAVAKLRGYTDDEIKSIDVLNDGYTLKDNGIELTTFAHVFTDNNLMNISVDAYESLKIDINNLKLNIKENKPSISISDITENSLLLTVSLDNIDGTKIDVYESTDNKEFKKIDTLELNDKKALVKYNELKENTNYYYKVVVSGKENYSEVVSTKTLQKETKVDAPLNSSPQSGYFDYVVICGGLLICVLFINNKIKNKSVLRKI